MQKKNPNKPALITQPITVKHRAVTVHDEAVSNLKTCDEAALQAISTMTCSFCHLRGVAVVNRVFFFFSVLVVVVVVVEERRWKDLTQRETRFVIFI